MFERLRKRWSSLTHPIIVKLGDTDPNILTWSSLVVSCISFWMIANASMDSSGAVLIFGSILMIGLAGVMDALDGDLARHQGSAGPYGDFLDHTIDRVVDIGIIVAIGFNSDFGVGPSLGFGAALLTLMGSYMGTQAQSVGLGRIYGGFSRADRMVITIIGMCLAGLQAADLVSFSVTLPGDIGRYAMLGLDQLNGFGLAVVFSAYGGFYTFITRFFSARAMLTQSIPKS